MGRFYLLLFLIGVCVSPAYADAIGILEGLPGKGRIRISAAMVALARRSVAYYLEKRSYLPVPKGLPPALMQQGAVFVTITWKGRPKGCMGSLKPHTPSLAEEIILMAVEAATRDHRVRPVRPGELPELRFAVSVVGKGRQIFGPESLNPRRYGLLVLSDRGSGVLLPGEAKTIHWQIQQCRRMAGARPGSPVRMYRFETLCFTES